jgi:two-component system response regulator
VQSAYEFGVNSYVVKPVDFRAFVELARTIKVYWLLTNEPPFQDTTAR